MTAFASQDIAMHIPQHSDSRVGVGITLAGVCSVVSYNGSARRNSRVEGKTAINSGVVLMEEDMTNGLIIRGWLHDGCTSALPVRFGSSQSDSKVYFAQLPRFVPIPSLVLNGLMGRTKAPLPLVKTTQESLQSSHPVQISEFMFI